MRRHSERKRWFLFSLLLLIVFIVNFPIITMFLNSFQSTAEIMSSRGLLPSSPSLENYNYLSARTKFWTYLRNSMVVSLGGTAASIVFAALAGYSLSRFRSLVITAYSRTLLMIQMFPLILALIPLFILFRNLGLVNTHLSVIILYTVVHLPFATWMFKAFFDSIPRELEEAAQVDGCTKLQGFGRIVLPLSGPGIAAVAIFSFLFSYNEYFIANVFLRNESVMTVPVGIQMFMQQYATDWGSLMAAATLATIPTFILFLLVQRFMIYGAVAGGVKG
jgi:ABC-type glycerol-3-phosphate transport system permease component